MEAPQGEVVSTLTPVQTENQQNGESELMDSSSQAESPIRAKRSRSRSTRYEDFVDSSELTRGKRRSLSGTVQDDNKESEPLSKRRRQQPANTGGNHISNGDSTNQQENISSSSNSISEQEPKKTEEKMELKVTVLPPTPVLASEEVIMCKICGKGDRDEQLLLCDGCDAGYHTFCMNPPMEDIPTGDWFCDNCIAKGKNKAPKRTVSTAVPDGVPLSEDDEFGVGEKVIVFWKEDSEYYPAFINGRGREKDTYIILFEDSVAHVIKRKHIFRSDEEIALKDAKPKKKSNEPKPEKKKSTNSKKKARSSPRTPPHVSTEPIPSVDKTIMTGSDDTSCKKCGSLDRADEMLLCDRCDVGWHMTCLEPPLEKIPEENWYCPECLPLVSARKNQHLSSVSKHELRSRHLSSENATKRREDRQRQASPNANKSNKAPLVIKISPPKPNIMDIKPMNADDFANTNKQETENSTSSAPATPPSDAKVEPEEPVEIIAAPAPVSQPAQPKPRTSHNPLDTIKIDKRPDLNSGPKSNMSKFWKGGLNFEGQYVCNMDAYCKADLLPSINKNDWPKILEGRRIDIIPSVPSEYTPVHILPEKSGASYDQFLQNLEKNLWVCAVTFPKRTLYIVPNTLLKEKGLLPNKPSLIGFFNTKIEPPTNPLQVLQKQQLAKAAAVTPNGNSADPRFMNKVRFSIVGYNLQDKRISNIIKFLTEHGGAEFSENIAPGKLDMIVIHPDKLKSPLDIPNFMGCKMDPKIKFIRGIDYLEQCCKAKAMVTPGPLERLLPGGALVVLATDVLLDIEDCLEKTVSILEIQKKLHPEFEYGIKLHRLTLNGVQNFSTNTEIAKKAHESVQKYINTKPSPIEVSKITDEEESKTPNAQIPSEVLRSVMKLSYIMAPKYRFTILITRDKKISQLAVGNAQCYDLEGLEKFFTEQGNFRRNSNSNSNVKSPKEKSSEEASSSSSLQAVTENNYIPSAESTVTNSSDPMKIS